MAEDRKPEARETAQEPAKSKDAPSSGKPSESEAPTSETYSFRDWASI